MKGKAKSRTIILIVITIITVALVACNQHQKIEAYEAYEIYDNAAAEINEAVGVVIDRTKELVPENASDWEALNVTIMDHIEIDKSTKETIQMMETTTVIALTEDGEKRNTANSYYKDEYVFVEAQNYDQSTERYKYPSSTLQSKAYITSRLIFTFPADSVLDTKIVEEEDYFIFTFHIRGTEAYSFMNDGIDYNTLDPADKQKIQLSDAIFTSVIDKKTRQLIEAKFNYENSFQDDDYTTWNNSYKNRIFNIKLDYVEIKFPNNLDDYPKRN